MLRDHYKSIICVSVVFVLFFSVLIYDILITDKKEIIVTELGVLNKTILGQPVEFSTDPFGIDVYFVELLPKAQTGWHTHDAPLIVTIIEGNLSVHYCLENFENSTKIKDCPNGEIIHNYSPGDVFVEAVNIQHNGINDDMYPVKLHIVTPSPTK